jgi:hypothetical protein
MARNNNSNKPMNGIIKTKDGEYAPVGNFYEIRDTQFHFNK